MTAYYYQFTQDSNIIGYTQPFHASLKDTMEKILHKTEALLGFCEKFSLNIMDVDIEIVPMRARGEMKLEFDFYYNGGSDD